MIEQTDNMYHIVKQTLALQKPEGKCLPRKVSGLHAKKNS